jgi:hypothetical protein
MVLYITAYDLVVQPANSLYRHKALYQLFYIFIQRNWERKNALEVIYGQFYILKICYDCAHIFSDQLTRKQEQLHKFLKWLESCENKAKSE